MTSLALVYDMQSTTFTWLIGVSSLRMNKSRFCFCAHFVYFCSWPCAFVCVKYQGLVGGFGKLGSNRQ